MSYFWDWLQKRQLIKREFTLEDGSKCKFEIYSIKNFWGYALHTFLPFLVQGDFRPNDPSAIYEFPNGTTLYDDFSGDIVSRNILHGNVLLGPPRLRQISVTKGVCKTSVFTNHMPTCYRPYTWFNENRGQHQGSAWVSMWEAGVTPINGVLEVYLGAGFVKSLTHNHTENVKLIESLRDSKWISRNTRIVVIEFNLYHIMTNLLESVKLRFEQSSFGGIIPSYSFTVIQRHSFFTSPERSLQVIASLYYVMVVLFTARDAAIITQIGFCKYIRRFRNCTDFFCYVLSYLMLIIHIVHYFHIEGLLKRMKRSDKYISLDWACVLVIAYNNIAGAAIFLIWARLLTFLIINRTMAVFVEVMRRSIHEMIGFSVMLVTFIMAYAECGLALFGD
ncbi:polycystin-2-like isoform X2 [Drosophila hydei]|uniref:Polycystin-2-like isoform X2 n=1 Tax=Drosophila hydei TaxID=7224 RepID=A0A6J1LFV7_DROHY|nr:polycystin-2-like isoform X2 [Drosophila hydei]